MTGGLLIPADKIATFGFTIDGNRGSGVQLRHNGLANIIFLDGHTEVCSKTRRKKLGVVQVYENDVTPVFLP
ncbi:MAG: hypothetical protein V2A65_10460 [Candidatus Omnitrophota bacterium]